LFALVGPQYRSWSSAQRTEFLVTWLSALPVIAAMNWFMARSERKAEAAAGQLWLPLSRRPRLRPVWKAALICWVLMIFVSSWPGWSWRATRGGPIWLDISQGLTWGSQIGMILPWVWSRRVSVELREHGVLSGPVVIKWSDVQDYRWSAYQQDHLIIRARRPRMTLTIPVPAALKEQVVAAFQRGLAAVKPSLD
jgi:hypothetical protein